MLKVTQVLLFHKIYFVVLDGGPWIRSNKETLDVLGPARQSPKLFHQVHFWQKSQSPNKLERHQCINFDGICIFHKRC